MLEMRNRIKDNESGFTLIELLVVILIIGVLAAIAIPIFLNQRQAASEASLKADIHNIQLNMENCKLKQNDYPDIWINWGHTSIPDCVTGLKTSTGNRFHAFDISYYYASGITPSGQVYCIESFSEGSGVTLYFRSDKGVFSTSICANQ